MTQMDLFILAFLAPMVFLGLAAVHLGVDSRPGHLDPRYPSANGLF
ncbi:MAG TPA: hypothetical protein VM427_05630 [Patescibacteria group bacterium]|nr:hypothetical protein [Patescibacteria group bacterium]